jgi:hypothetical protein
VTFSARVDSLEVEFRVPDLHSHQECTTLPAEGFYTGTLIPDLLAIAERECERQ